MEFNNYVLGGADNTKRDHSISNDQRERRYGLILAQFVEKFAQGLYDQFFINRYQTFTKNSHGISLWISIYKIIQRVSISADQWPENRSLRQRFTSLPTEKR